MQLEGGRDKWERNKRGCGGEYDQVHYKDIRKPIEAGHAGSLTGGSLSLRPIWST